ncbi:hypothetical protein D3C81_1885200 [compost metagenome]
MFRPRFRNEQILQLAVDRAAVFIFPVNAFQQVEVNDRCTERFSSTNILLPAHVHRIHSQPEFFVQDSGKHGQIRSHPCKDCSNRNPVIILYERIDIIAAG